MDSTQLHIPQREDPEKNPHSYVGITPVVAGSALPLWQLTLREDRKVREMPQGPWTTRFTHGGICMYACISSIMADRGSTPDGNVGSWLLSP